VPLLLSAEAAVTVVAAPESVPFVLLSASATVAPRLPPATTLPA